jgi:hypothetical protein
METLAPIIPDFFPSAPLLLAWGLCPQIDVGPPLLPEMLTDGARSGWFWCGVITAAAGWCKVFLSVPW